MSKVASLAIRIAPELKAKLERDAERDGRSLASYVERILTLHGELPKWQLDGCNVEHRKGQSPRVRISVAEGWPQVELLPEHAEDLAESLRKCARSARALLE